MSRPLLGGQTFIYRGRVYARHIPLFSDPGGVQALKTGFTQEAGYNLAVSAWREIASNASHIGSASGSATASGSNARASSATAAPTSRTSATPTMRRS